MRDQIIELFWYSSKDRELFPYIDAYMIALENWLGKNQMNDEQLVRYMLVGIFLHYRAANHVGDDFNTITYGEWNRAIFSKKTIQQFQTINQYLGHPIDTTEEYLQLLQIKDLSKFTRSLFDFVVIGPSLTNQSVE
jgi:hypothetical protein